MTEAVQTFLQFRTPFTNQLAATARRRGLDTREATALLMSAEAAMDELLVATMTGHSLAEVVPRPEFIGQTIGKINFRQQYGVNIIAIQKRLPVVTPEGKNSFQILINDLPKPTDEIEDNDVLVVVGSDENIERLARGV